MSPAALVGVGKSGHGGATGAHILSRTPQGGFLHLGTDGWLAVAGLVATLVALAVVAVQARRAQTTKQAEQSVERQNDGERFKLCTAELEGLERRIRDGMRAENRPQTEIAMEEWRKRASEYLALCRKIDTLDGQLEKDVQRSLVLVDVALEQLVEGVWPAAACRHALRGIGATCACGRAVVTDLALAGAQG